MLRGPISAIVLWTPLVLNAGSAAAQPDREVQTPPTPAYSPAESLSTILRDLSAGTLLKMQLDNEKWMQGELIRTTDSEILLSPELFEEARVPFASIDSLWIEHGNRMERGIFWGAVIGGAVGALALFVASPVVGHHALEDYAWNYVAIGGIAGIGVGIGIGAWVGATTPDWKKLYP